jgi:hypothetical protein
MKFLTESELEAVGLVTKSKLRKDRHLKIGIPYIKVGRLVRYRESDVEAFCQANLQTVGEKPPVSAVGATG